MSYPMIPNKTGKIEGLNRHLSLEAEQVKGGLKGLNPCSTSTDEKVCFFGETFYSTVDLARRRQAHTVFT